MKYGMNQWGIAGDEPDPAHIAEVLSAAGYDGYEPNYTENGTLATTEGQKELKKTLDLHSLAVPAVSSTLLWEYPLSSDDTATRQKGMEIGKEMIEAAVAIDAQVVLIVPAVVPTGSRYDAHYERAASSIRELATYADEQDIQITIENVQNNFLPSPVEFVDFLEAVSDAGPVGAYFDVGNAFRSGRPERWLRTLDEWIVTIHVKDWIRDSHLTTYPLQGDVDWQIVAETLEGIGYEGWITAEVPPYGSFPERMPKQVLENIKYLFGDLESESDTTHRHTSESGGRSQ